MERHRKALTEALMGKSRSKRILVALLVVVLAVALTLAVNSILALLIIWIAKTLGADIDYTFKTVLAISIGLTIFRVIFGRGNKE